MAKYMVTYELAPEHRDEAIKRFSTDARNAPEGVDAIGRWHSVSTGHGYLVVQTADPAKITGWLLKWSDIIAYEVDPVIDDDELGAQLQAGGLLS